MRSTLAFVLAVLVVASTVALPMSAVAATAQQDPGDRDDDPSTEGTIGYVEGYWYDDELPVDERDAATVEDGDELEAVVYRSMARVETIRERPFREAVPVEVIDREAFRARSDELIQIGERDRFVENVRHEATFLVDRDTDAVEAYEALRDDAVGGYYDPETDEAVVVAEDTENPEVDEVVLGHELVHALQDQHFDLSSFDRETFDRDVATNGLVEGDAAYVEAEYDRRCGVEWECLEPEAQPPASAGDLHEGVFFGMYQPYEDGPDYVEHLLTESGGDWAAVDERFDDPPASATEVIRPGETHEPAAIDFEDRSNEDWSVLEPDEGATAETYGEVGIVAMFADGALDRDDPSVLSREAFLSGFFELEFEYDHPIAEGWAGDELVVYRSADQDPNESGSEDPNESDAEAPNESVAGDLDETGFVWQSEWESAGDAEAFLEGYLELLAFHGSETVDERQDTVVIEDEYPGAYYVDRDAETVTIVRAPSVGDLPAVRDGAAPAGEDTLDFAGAADAGSNASGTDANPGADPDADGVTGDGSIPGFGVTAAVLATLVGALFVARTARRR